MKFKLYLSDWAYNIGIIGFIRILEHNEVDRKLYTMRENYLEIDSSIFEEFADYYFDYFISIFDFTDRVSQTFNTAIKQFEDDEDLKLRDYIKSLEDRFSKYQKAAARTEYEDEYKKLLKDLKSFKSAKRDQVDEDEFIGCLREIDNFIHNDEIRKKRAVNILRAEFGNFFGQVSFLNPAFKGVYAKDFVQKMKVDFIDVIELEEDEKTKKKGRRKVYNCSFCSRETDHGYNFEESNFYLVGVSNKNQRNFFWDQNFKMPICPLCRLIFMCLPAGAIKRTQRSGESVYNFVNLDTDINSLYKINSNFRNRLSSADNPFKEIMLDLIGEMSQKSTWTLQNILFIEFTLADRKGTLSYLNIPTYKANFFCDSRVIQSFGGIYDRQFQLDVMDYILTDRDLKYLVDKQIRNSIKQERKIGGNQCYNAIKLRFFINSYRKGSVDMSSKRLYFAYNEGQKIGKHLNNNKINAMAYKLLNAIKVGNRSQFFDVLVRSYMGVECEVPRVFLNVYSEKDMDFESVAQAFVAGLVSSKEKDENKEEN